MAAGQLDGPLYPTHDMSHPAVNASFGAAMQAWNEHKYQEAVALFRVHVAQYPNSPWASEALLHIGCDALLPGRYSEANSSFQLILQANQGNPYPGAQMMIHKTRIRLANLKTAQGNFAEAMEQYRLLKQYSPDWRQRTYAAHWIQRLSRGSQHHAAIFNCGTQALACLLEKRGRKAEVARVLGLQASSPRGQSMRELQLVAAGYGYRLTGVRLTVSQLQKLPLPAIVQLSGLHQGDLGHYWVLKKVTRDNLEFYDPQNHRHFSQTTTEFAREWGGHALVLARNQKLPGAILATREMENLFGGCCCHPAPPGDQGPPEPPPGDPDCKPTPGDDTCPRPGCGSPVWSVNKINMNLYVRDIPLWYRSPIGPPVEISLNYNSQSSSYHEPFGHKWQFNYATFLVEDSVGTVTVYMPDGRCDVFSADGTGGYTAPSGVHNRLLKVGDSHYELWLPDDTNLYRFVKNSPVDYIDPDGLLCDGPPDAPDLPSNSPKCEDYQLERYTPYFYGVPAGRYGLACFCKCAGDSSWSRRVRGCLRCMRDHRIPCDQAHKDCYAKADKTFPAFPWSRPWISAIIPCMFQCAHGDGPPNFSQ